MPEWHPCGSLRLGKRLLKVDRLVVCFGVIHNGTHQLVGKFGYPLVELARGCSRAAWPSAQTMLSLVGLSKPMGLDMSMPGRYLSDMVRVYDPASCEDFMRFARAAPR